MVLRRPSLGSPREKVLDMLPGQTGPYYSAGTDHGSAISCYLLGTSRNPRIPGMLVRGSAPSGRGSVPDSGDACPRLHPLGMWLSPRIPRTLARSKQRIWGGRAEDPFQWAPRTDRLPRSKPTLSRGSRIETPTERSLLLRPLCSHYPVEAVGTSKILYVLVLSLIHI